MASAIPAPARVLMFVAAAIALVAACTAAAPVIGKQKPGPGKVKPGPSKAQDQFECVPGQFWNATTRLCKNCPFGTFSAFRGELLCTGCATETTCCPAADGPDKCVRLNQPCPPIQTCRVQPTSPTDCPPGTYWDGFEKVCKSCPKGFACEGFGLAPAYCEPPTKTCCAGESLCKAKRAPCPKRCPTIPTTPTTPKPGPVRRSALAAP